MAAPRPLDPSERRAAELRLHQLRAEEDMRRSNIGRVSDALNKMDADEHNIDLRIRQAELEYELGREELALLGMGEGNHTFAPPFTIQAKSKWRKVNLIQLFIIL